MFKLLSVLLSTLLYVSSSVSVQSAPFTTPEISQLVNHYLQAIADPKTGIGARPAGTAKEQETIKYLEKNFQSMGLSVRVQPFPFGKKKLSSANVIADLNKDKETTLILAAHLDSTGEKFGSQGAIDNATGLATMLTVAKKMATIKNLPYNVRFIAFGAEEIGTLGSKYYVKTLLKEKGATDNIAAMINLDTVAGGDFLYVHSAHSTPYRCRDVADKYNSDTHVRDALFTIAKKRLTPALQYIIHPAYEGYPEGETGQWSDHAAFACAGVPIAYIESTNFTLNGKDGYDGYSQSENKALWDCFDQKTHSACQRKKEKQWGHIWHTKADQLTVMEQLFSGRISQQLTANVEVLVAFLSHYEPKAKK
ncbi:M28 family metallopeptidase [Thalassotalea piscium]